MGETDIVTQILTAEYMHSGRDERHHEQHGHGESIDMSAHLDDDGTVGVPGEGMTDRLP